MPFILRVALPKNAALRGACGVPECSEGAKLSAKGPGVGVGGVSPPTGRGVWVASLRKILALRMP